MDQFSFPPGFQDLLSFKFLDALLGRRSRRFFMGAEIPDGVFAYKSPKAPVPLSELEKILVAAACGGNTSWHDLIFRAERYAPYLSNYAGSAGGRTFPSSAGFHTSVTFFTDDDGVYVLEARDASPFTERRQDGSLDLPTLLETLKGRVRKIRQGRLKVPPEVPIRRSPQYVGCEPAGDSSGHSGGRSGPASASQSLLHAPERPSSPG